MRISSNTFRLIVGALLLLAFVEVAGAAGRRIFITSVSGNGRLGDWPDAGLATGLAAGDAICRARAAAGGLANASSFRAWLSTSTTDAWCHLHGVDGEQRVDSCGGGVFLAYGPWYSPNGGPALLPRLSTLTTSGDRITYAPIAFNEYGVQVPDAGYYAWTGTEPTGVADSKTCNNWTSGSSGYDGQFGSALHAGDLWTATNWQSCDNVHHLICMEPGLGDTYTQRWSPGRMTFVTSTVGPAVMANWPGANGAAGIAAGDEACKARAHAGHLPDPDSFWAWLSDDTHDAKSKLTGVGPIRRIDGYLVAGSNADLIDGRTNASIHVDELYDYLTFTTMAWTGTTGAGVKSGLNCLNWTSTSAENGVVGAPLMARKDGWTSSIQVGCFGSTHLYCFSNTYVLFWDGFEYSGDTSRWSAVAP